MEGQKSDDNALLTLVERKTRNAYAILLDDQDHESVDYTMNQLFQDVFKTITSDNGSVFSNLLLSLKDVTVVYFARPCAPLMKGVYPSAVLFEQELAKLA